MVKFKKTELNKTAFEQKVAAGTVKNDDITFLSNEKKIWSDGVYYDCNSDAVQTNLNTHTSNKSNPHSVTKAQVGLGNVNNTSDANKPVSTAQATAIADAKKAGTDAQTNLDTHTANKSNPHGVTKAQVGLGNVTNESKTTMFTSPTFTGTPKAPTATTGTNTTQIATTAFVQSAIDNKLAANDAMLFKGTIGTNGTITALPDTHNAGWTYKVITAGTYAGIKCEVGDMIICITDGTAANNAHWTVVQTNIDGAVTGPAASTTNHIATFNGTTGKVIKDSGYTIATSVPSGAKFTDTTYSAGTGMSLSGTTFNHSNSITAGTASGDAAKTLTWGGTFTIPSITYDAQGHITAKGSTTMTMPGNPNSHYTTALKVGASATATANAAATNGNVYLNLMDNTTIRDSHKIVGSGATTVTSDANGNITIKSTDSNTDTKNTAGSTDSSSKLFIIGAASQAANPQTYSHDTAYIGTDGCLYSGGSKVLTAHQSLANYVPWSTTTMEIVNGINNNPQFFNIQNENLIANYRNYWSVINFGSFSNGNYRSQIAMPYDSNITDTDMFIRTATSTTWREWRRVLHDGNYSSILDSRYYTESEVNTKLTNGSVTKVGTASKGSATQPIYLNAGVPTACTYTLGKSVPSNAVFTDTVYTHPTTAGNKHIPAGGSAGQILRWSADGTAVWGADNNTTYSAATATTLGLVKIGSNITNTSGTISITKDNIVAALGYTPPTSNTDTHWTTHLYAGTGTAANAATTNGNTKLTITDNTTVRNSITLKGTGATTVVSDANGVITVNSTNTTYNVASTTANGLMSKEDKAKLDGITGTGSYTLPTATTSALGGIKVGYTNSGKNYKVQVDSNGNAYVNVPWTDNNTTYSNMTAATASAAGKAGLVPAPAAGKQTSFLRGDGTWVIPTNTTYGLVSTSANGLMPKLPTNNINGNFVPKQQFLNGEGRYAALYIAYTRSTNELALYSYSNDLYKQSSITLPLADLDFDGLMSKEDKNKLDCINLSTGNRVVIEEANVYNDATFPIYFSDTEDPDGGDILGYSSRFTYNPDRGEVKGGTGIKTWMISPNRIELNENSFYVNYNSDTGIVNMYSDYSLYIQDDGDTYIYNTGSIRMNPGEEMNLFCELPIAGTTTTNNLTIGAIIAGSVVTQRLVNMTLNGNLTINSQIGAPICKLGATSEIYEVRSVYFKNYSNQDLTISSSASININATGNIITNKNIAVSSDQRSKHDIKQIPDKVLENINKIEYKQFKYNNGNEDDEYGVIAQEVLETGIPNIVRGSEESLYSVNYNNLFILEIVNLKKQIKELQEQVKTLINVVSELS